MVMTMKMEHMISHWPVLDCTEILESEGLIPRFPFGKTLQWVCAGPVQGRPSCAEALPEMGQPEGGVTASDLIHVNTSFTMPSYMFSYM